VPRPRVPHGFDRVGEWLSERARCGAFLLALDFDGTLAPIVERPEAARPLPAARDALGRLVARTDTTVAILSGRRLEDVRQHVAVPGIYYAGNHGMEIDGPDLHRVQPEAAAARPALDTAVALLEPVLGPLSGVQLEDKGLTLSVHYRRAGPGAEAAVRAAAQQVCLRLPQLRATAGKKVIELRPAVDWDKGRALEFLLDVLHPGTAAWPAVFMGDDRTDEDAFRALRGMSHDVGRGARGAGTGGAGATAGALREAVLVAEEPPPDTAASCFLRSPAEVAAVLDRLAEPS
jgi:trehalose 6-phosphate phosphatase